MKKLILTSLSLLLIISLSACKDTSKDMREDEYAKALELIDAEKYQEAIGILEPLGDYKSSKDQLWFARMRIVEDYLLDFDFKSAYDFLSLQDEEFIKVSTDYIYPLVCSFFDRTYRNLDDNLKNQYGYALKICEMINAADDSLGHAIKIVNDNFDQLLNWQSADKLITGCDVNLNMTHEAIIQQWKEQDYGSIGHEGTTFRDMVIFYINDGLKLNETGEKIFVMYDMMANNLESVYIENSYEKKKNSFENFLGFYDAYKALFTVYENEYLVIINELDKIDSILFHN